MKEKEKRKKKRFIKSLVTPLPKGITPFSYATNFIKVTSPSPPLPGLKARVRRSLVPTSQHMPEICVRGWCAPLPQSPLPLGGGGGTCCFSERPTTLSFPPNPSPHPRCVSSSSFFSRFTEVSRLFPGWERFFSVDVVRLWQKGSTWLHRPCIEVFNGAAWSSARAVIPVKSRPARPHFEDQFEGSKRFCVQRRGLLSRMDMNFFLFDGLLSQ